MNITLDVPDALVRSYIESAGSGYWARSLRVSPAGKPLAFTITELEPSASAHNPDRKPEPRGATADDIAAGLAILAVKYPHHFRDLVADKGDMFTGDALIQCALFGDLVYG